MANDCERKFRIWLNKQFKEAYIKKIPDFKQTGQSGGRGLPDYMVIDKGRTIWYEVKKVNSDKTFPYSAINDGQWETFTAMMRAGADILIAVYMNKVLWVFPYAVLYVERTSAPLESTSVLVEKLIR